MIFNRSKNAFLKLFLPAFAWIVLAPCAFPHDHLCGATILAEKLGTVGRENIRLSVVSSDCRHLLFVTGNARGGNGSLVFDGKVLGNGSNIEGLAINHNGSHYAYAAHTIATRPGETGPLAVFLDGKQGGSVVGLLPYVLSGTRRFAFNPNGDHLTYYALQDDGWQLFIDLKPVPNATCSAVMSLVTTRDYLHSVEGPFVYNADGRHLAYLIEPTPHSWSDTMPFRYDAAWVVDGKARQLGRGVAARQGPVGNFAFSTDGNHFAYSTEDNDECKIWLDDKLVGACPDVFSGPFLSPDGKHVAYVQGRLMTPNDPNSLETSLFVDFKADSSAPKGSPERSIRQFFFKPDSTPGAYINGHRVMVENGGHVRNGAEIVIGNKKSGEYDEIWSVQFSANGAHCICAAQKDNKDFVLFDGSPAETASAVDPPIFSPDGKHTAWGIQPLDTDGGNWQMVLDGQAIPDFGLMRTKLALPVEQGRDNLVAPPYRFDSDNHLIFIGQKDGNFFHVEVSP